MGMEKDVRKEKTLSEKCPVDLLTSIQYQVPRMDVKNVTNRGLNPLALYLNS